MLVIFLFIFFYYISLSPLSKIYIINLPWRNGILEEEYGHDGQQPNGHGQLGREWRTRRSSGA